MTAHHLQHDRNQNLRTDIGWAHSSCHDSYHKEDRRAKKEEAEEEDQGLLDESPQAEDL
jgi:hypothetical protein